MKSINQRIWILAAAVGLAAGSPALAQYRINTGNVRDANNRIGSGNLNDGGNNGRSTFSGVTGNELITGNVTGGKEFRGTINYTDPRAFRGNSSSTASDNFIRGSSGTPYGGFGGSNSNANTVRSFYGDSRAVPPPVGYTKMNIGSSGYVPAGPEMRLGSDLRLGNPLETTTVALPKLGETVLPGPVDASNNNTLITASSLYGVRQWNAGNESDQAFVSRFANPFGQPIKASMSDTQVNDIRAQVNKTGENGQNPDQNGPGSNDINQDLNKALGQPLVSPQDSALQSDQLQSSIGGTAIQGGLSTGESARARMVGSPTTQRSETMLEQRIQQNNPSNRALADAEAARQYNKDLLAKKNQQATEEAKRTVAANQPSQATAADQAPNSPQSTTPGTPTPTSKTPPVQVDSIYKGVRAPGLADILKKAEDFMHQGKWTSAIEQFDLAQRVAPNNMMVAIGRANAELGGSYYARAETDLRLAYTKDPTTMDKQYDLRGMIGDERLQQVVKDLKDVNAKQPEQARTVFLLAYVSYNTGNERMATGYLDLAEKRAGANETFYGTVRKHWVLPQGGELNK